jgi:hypothetical protein
MSGILIGSAVEYHVNGGQGKESIPLQGPGTVSSRLGREIKLALYQDELAGPGAGAARDPR